MLHGLNAFDGGMDNFFGTVSFALLALPFLSSGEQPRTAVFNHYLDYTPQMHQLFFHNHAPT